MSAKKKNQIIHLLTPEGEALQNNPTAIPWNTYPRPQMRRDSFFCLNGEWEFENGADAPTHIRVPFCPESLLSGVGMPPSDLFTADYRRTFTLPEGFNKGRVLLHFGAVDSRANIFLNGERIGFHEGGYEAFSFDVTDYLGDENLLEIECWDNLTYHVLPYGKQRKDRGGMWYTPVSGIWQSVWLECVPNQYIRKLNIENGINKMIS